MVLMRELTVYIDDDVFTWLEGHRGRTELSDLAGRLLAEHVRSCPHSASLHGDLIKRLDELEGRIKRLNQSLGACNVKR
jgi:hypothetical protein